MWVGAEQRGRHRIRSRLRAPSCRHRARCGAWTHKLWDHDLNRSRMLNRLSHPGAPKNHFDSYGTRGTLTCRLSRNYERILQPITNQIFCRVRCLVVLLTTEGPREDLGHVWEPHRRFKAWKKNRQISLQRNRMCFNSVPFFLIEGVKVLVYLFLQRVWSNGSIFGNNDFLKVRIMTLWNVPGMGCEMFSGRLYQWHGWWLIWK